MFSISQAGLAAGADDVSRTDGLSTGAQVTLTYTGSGTFRPRFLFVPPGDTTAASTLTQASPGVWTFSPTAGVAGSYRIQGIENEGKVSEKRSTPRIFGIRNARGILVPAFGEAADLLANLDNASATVVKRSENNAVDYSTSALNLLSWTGWWRFFQELANSALLLAFNSSAINSLTTGSEFPASVSGGVATLDPHNRIASAKWRSKEAPTNTDLYTDSPVIVAYINALTLLALDNPIVAPKNHTYAAVLSSRITIISESTPAHFAFVDIVAPFVLTVDSYGNHAYSVVPSDAIVSSTAVASMVAASATVSLPSAYAIEINAVRPPGVDCTVLRHDTAIIELQEIA
jgi:hypothetical protein